jgi:hypothetical protein
MAAKWLWKDFALPGKDWQGYFIDPLGNTYGLFWR